MASPALSLWQPSPNDLSSLTQLLINSTSGRSDIQAQVMQQLASFDRVPDYPKYLAYIFALTKEASPTRAVAGLTLKNNIRNGLDIMAPETLEYVKACVMQAFSDPEDVVRSTAGTIITTVLTADFSKWPEALSKILELLDAPQPAISTAAFSALEKICEDSANTLNHSDQNVLAFLLQKCIQHFENPNMKIRAHALRSVNHFIMIHADPLMNNIEGYVQALYKRTADEHPDVRKALCQALVMILEVRPDVILPQLDNVVAFMLFCTQAEDATVALEACEFWLAFAEQEAFREHLFPHLQKIIPVLMKSMVYSEEDIMLLGGDDDDGDVADSEQDIKPRHHKARTHAQEHDKSDQQQKAADDDDDSDYFDDDDDDDVYSEWTLRKCAAATIDVLSNSFGSSILDMLLPILQEFLHQPRWEVREAGILALGAIAEGCFGGLSPHLSQLIPSLITTLSDPKPLVKSITCWTMGRYSRWILHPEHHVAPTEQEYRIHLQTYFQPALEALLRMVVDNNKRVQEAGCSALATIEEEAGEEITPYLGPILQTLAFAFQKYQHKNLLILYDAVGTLADAVGRALADPQHINVIVPPLIHKWQTTGDQETDLFALFECMSSVAVALGPEFAQFAPVVWERSLRLIKNTLIQIDMYAKDPVNTDIPDKDFMIVGLDLISGVVQGLGPACSSLVTTGDPNILTLLLICMKDPSSDVCQSSFALLGDLAISVYDKIVPQMNDFLGECIRQMNPVVDNMYVSVCNNATWSVGEIALRHGAQMEPFVPLLLERLIALLLRQNTPRTLLENAAIALGRLGFVLPNSVAPHLEKFMQQWCLALRSIRDNAEKESAYLGMCKMIQANPHGAIKFLGVFADAIAQWNTMSQGLAGVFHQTLHMFKNGMGDQWAQAMASFPPPVQQKLVEKYGL